MKIFSICVCMLIFVLLSSGFFITNVIADSDYENESHIQIVTQQNILSWYVGGHETSWSWVKVYLSSINYIQINFAVLDNIGLVSADTKDNTSIVSSSLINVNSNLAYFNFSVSHSAQTGSFVHKFTREYDVFNEPYILHHAWTVSSSSYTELNLTVVRLNMWSDSNFDYDWIIDVLSNPNKRFLWQVGDRSDTGYHSFKYDNENMLILQSNTGNFANIVNKADYNVATHSGYIGSQIANKTWAKWYDADGDLYTAMKLIVPNTYKLRGGNWLNLLPDSNYIMLNDYSYNSTLFERASQFGVTHVNLETFLITPGTYYFTNSSVSSAVWRIRNLTHQYNMILILPSYWKDFVTGVGSPITTYTYSNRVKILNAWNNYTGRFGGITDEFSIGYGDFNGLTWNYWNWDMQETAFSNISGRDLTIWSYQLWYMDSKICYLNTEDWGNWYFNYMDTYNYYSDPCYEMMGQKTVSFDLRVTGISDISAIWTYKNETFENRLTKEAYKNGWGISVFYNKTFYSDNLGFSYSQNYLSGLIYEMSLVYRSVVGLINGTQYESTNNIAVVGDEVIDIIVISSVLSHPYTLYFVANGVDNSLVYVYDASITFTSGSGGTYHLNDEQLGDVLFIRGYDLYGSTAGNAVIVLLVIGGVLSLGFLFTRYRGELTIETSIKFILLIVLAIIMLSILLLLL